MGAPKQKWTAEEEYALKAGVKKHGQGKWRTILKDPEFSGLLCLRSNVDLKDKWRNLSVTANGWGSREKNKGGSKSFRQSSKHHIISKEVSTEINDMDDAMVDARPIATGNGSSHARAEKRPFTRMDKLIEEAIANLEPSVCNQTNIAMYIQERYECELDFARSLSSALKEMTARGRLIKAKRGWYKIAPEETFILEERASDLQRTVVKVQDSKHLSSSPVDGRSSWMDYMTAEEAAADAAAAQAVAEAEEAMARARDAMAKAEALEADAEAAQAFLQVLLLTMNKRTAAADKMIRV